MLHGDPFALWSIGRSVLAPVFNGGRLRTTVDANLSRLDQALITYERTVLGAFVEVEDQWPALKLLHDQAVELEAQRTLFSVEQAAAQLRGDVLVAYVNLYRALGGGWSR